MRQRISRWLVPVGRAVVNLTERYRVAGEGTLPAAIEHRGLAVLTIGLALWLLLTMLPGCETVQTATPARWGVASVSLAEVEGLSDCTLTKLTTGVGLPNLFVVRCPLSVTAASWTEGQGKSAVERHTAVIDGAVEMPDEVVVGDPHADLGWMPGPDVSVRVSGSGFVKWQP